MGNEEEGGEDEREGGEEDEKGGWKMKRSDREATMREGGIKVMERREGGK